MTSFRPISIAAAAAALVLIPASTTFAQRQQATPEQRIDRLERQVQQMQRQVFPKGRPADTTGFADDPAASQSSVISLDQRLDALERQMTDIVRLSEENGHLLRTLQSDLATARSDQDTRMNALEQRIAQGALEPAPVSAVTTDPAAPPKPKPKPVPIQVKTPGDSGASSTAATDAGELAYTEGYKAWEAGRYDEAISLLREFTSAYPGHRRVSFANNLVGRALIDQGDAQAATKVLLANYRNNPKGERAPDSLYYLGQALIRLGQPGQACKVYAELDAVYGAKIRPDLKKLEMEAKTEARC
ncbi:MAG: tetratricopeptide repeat protein [Sphingomicrobium sp.]